MYYWSARVTLSIHTKKLFEPRFPLRIRTWLIPVSGKTRDRGLTHLKEVLKPFFEPLASHLGVKISKQFGFCFYLAWVLNWLILSYTLKVIKETAYESRQKFNCEHNSCWKLLDSECIIFCLFLLLLFVYTLSLNHHRSGTGFKWSCRNQAWLYGKAMFTRIRIFVKPHSFLHESALRPHETSEFGYRNRIFVREV